MRTGKLPTLCGDLSQRYVDLRFRELYVDAYPSELFVDACPCTPRAAPLIWPRYSYIGGKCQGHTSSEALHLPTPPRARIRKVRGKALLQFLDRQELHEMLHELSKSVTEKLAQVAHTEITNLASACDPVWKDQLKEVDCGLSATRKAQKDAQKAAEELRSKVKIEMENTDERVKAVEKAVPTCARSCCAKGVGKRSARPAL